ncbi:MAG: prepilin-type N-terminal cleavage/methylation domain-containing protein [Candidatus Omnitrophica bacterium]|nr:prepilin-type N-terminal cleavage/methylation domain-containing protein [Candidatus Omnitrophota bacterium]
MIKRVFYRKSDRLNMRGFTLVELMVVATIFVMLILAIFAISSGGTRAWFTSEAQMDINMQARRIIQQMTDEISQAGPGRVTITNISASEDNIIFQMPVSFALGVLTWSDQIQYSLGGINGQQIVRARIDPATSVVLETQTFANYVTALRFNYIDTEQDALAITLTLIRQSVAGDNLQIQLNSQVAFRNR